VRWEWDLENDNISIVLFHTECFELKDMPIIPATQEAEIGRINIRSQTRANSETLS
jgi:hypothetical protein